MRDLMNSIHVKRAISPVVVTDNTAQVSQIIDTLGHDSLTFAIALGALSDADATAVVLIEDGDAANLSDAAAVADSQLIGTELLAGFQFDDDNECRKIGYAGFKRYVRLTIRRATNTGNIPVSALAILGHPQSAPTSNPPA